MDKRKYLTKILIAEFKDESKFEEVRFTETAYRLKDGKIIIEFNGNGCSLYGVKISFSKHIGRSGIYEIFEDEYERWKRIRCKNEYGVFVDWENEREESYKDYMEADILAISSMEHERVLELVSGDELPY